MVSDDDMMSSTSTNHREVDINSESHSSDGEESNLVVPISGLHPVIIMQLKSERKLKYIFFLKTILFQLKDINFPLVISMARKGNFK